MHASTSLPSLQLLKNKGRSCTSKESHAKIFSDEFFHENAAEDEAEGAVQEEATDEVRYFCTVLTELAFDILLNQMKNLLNLFIYISIKP